MVAWFNERLSNEDVDQLVFTKLFTISRRLDLEEGNNKLVYSLK